MNRMIRVAISDRNLRCDCNEGIGDADYCSQCQRVYASETDVRSDYADTTIGYFKTVEEADVCISQLTTRF